MTAQPDTTDSAPTLPQDPDKASKKLFIKTYGCQMNVYDSERMAALLKPLGYESQQTSEDADLVILNTCHIREKAAEKVYSELGRLRKQKERKTRSGGEMKIAVAGCVAQAEGREITARAKHVDLVFGPQTYHRLPEMIARAARGRGDVLETDFAVEEKFDTLPLRQSVDGFSAFVTIQEGCDKFCTFCVVPYTRGAEVSRPVEAVTMEVRNLAALGVREVTLLGQNVNAYHAAPPTGHVGGGVSGNWGLGHLVRHLAKIDGIERIRFTTSHPKDMDDTLIEALGEESKLMPYLHLPVQAGSDKVLKAMNRGHTAAYYIDLLARIRAARPDIAVSGDFIVGFPGEGDAEFEQTMEVIREIRYASAFSFKYSRRPGTPGATLPLQVPESEKTDRLTRLQALLEEQKQSFNAAQVGRTIPVLLEKTGRHPGQIVGRSPYLQAVHCSAPEHLLGQIVDLHIIGKTANALSGEIERNRRTK